MTADEFLDAPDATTTASTFADAGDLAAYHRARASGASEDEALRVGDNGVGHPDLGGLDTTRADVPMVALPSDVLVNRFGSVANARGQYVDLQHQGNGQSVRALIADVGPGRGAVRRGVGLDLNPGAAAALGASGSDPVSYTFAGSRPSFGSADAFLDAGDGGGDAKGGGTSQGSAAPAVPVPGRPDNFLVSNDGGALARAQASLRAENPDATATKFVLAAPTPAAPAPMPSLGSADAFLDAPANAPAAGMSSNLSNNPFAVAAPAAGTDLQPVASVPPAARNVTPSQDAAGNPFAVAASPQDTLADTFTPQGKAFLDKLVAPNPALMPPDESAGHQVANAGKEVLGGAASGTLKTVEGFNRAMAGQESSTPQSTAAAIDNQIAQRQQALDKLNALPPEKGTDSVALVRESIEHEIHELMAQRADARLALPVGSTPGLLTPAGQAARDRRTAAASASADADKAAQEDVPTLFGQDPAPKDTMLARIARSGGEAVPLIGSSLIPGAGGVAAAGVAGLQAKGEAYDEYYGEARARGVDEEQARQEADQYSDAVALRTVPEMATYLGTGKVAAGVVSKLLSPSAPAAVRALASAAASTTANAGAGTVNQLVEQGLNGKPLDPSYSVERGVQDALFGALHGISETHGPENPPAVPADRSSTADAMHQALNQDDGNAAPPTAAPAAPEDRGTTATPRRVPETQQPVPDNSAADASAPVYATGNTPQERAESLLSSSSDEAPATAARFEPDEDVPTTLGRFPRTAVPDGSTVVYDPAVHDAEDFTLPAPSEPTSSPASTANTFTDAEAARRGLAPAAASAQRDFGTTWGEAKDTLASDPTAGQRLVDELKAKPRPVSDAENALLLHQQIGAQAEHDAAVQAVNEAGDDAARASAQVRLARASDALSDVYTATKAAGAETGRGLNARKMLANQDYSLGSMLAKRQAAEGGRPLTDDQQAQVRAAHAKVADAQAKLDAHQAMVDDVDAAMAGARPAQGDPDWSTPDPDGDAEAQHRADLTQQAREGIDNAGGVELLSAVRDAGGLPTDDSAYRGELQTIREAHAPVAQAGRTGTFNLFRGDAPKLDELTSRLRARGFDVQTPDDALNLIYDRLTTKKPVYGFGAREDAQSGMAGSQAYFRRQPERPTAPPRTPEELRPLQQQWTRALRMMSPSTALKLEVIKQSTLDSMWHGQERPTAADGSSPHAAYLDGAVYLSDRALRENPDYLNRTNLLHEIAHHFERALPLAERMRLDTQWKQEMASGKSPLHDADGTPRADVDPRAFDTSDPRNASEWLAERLAADHQQHFADKINAGLAGAEPPRQTATARLAGHLRDFVGKVWRTLRPGMDQNDLNARFRDWLGKGARVDGAGQGAQAAVRPRADYVQGVRDFFAGRLPANAVLEMGRPGDILRRAGLENLPIRLSQRVLRRKTGKHPELSQDLVERLPDLINRPTMVYDTPGDPTGKGVITSEQTPGGKTLTVFANLKVDGDRAVVYNVKSLYGKIPDELLRELHQSPRIGYADAEKAPAWARHSASQTREPFQQLPALLDKIDRASQGGESQGGTAPQFAQRRTLAEQGYHPASDEERKSLGIPPAWKDVHVADDPSAARVAVGKDSKGRTQSRYSVEHTSIQQAAKFERGRRFDEALPGIMDRVHQSLDTSHGAEEAAVLRLIHQTGFRNGGDEDTGGAVKAYGASNLRAEHVRFDGDTTHFDFTGKLGVRQQHSLTDPEITADLRERAADGGALFHTTDARVRDYLKGSGDFKVHDFRTWNATDLAAKEVASRPAPRTADEFWNERDRIGDLAAKKLGDTRKIALESYVNPAVFEPWKASLGITDENRPTKRTNARAEASPNAENARPAASARGEAAPAADARLLRDEQLPGRPAAGEQAPAALRSAGGLDPLAERMRQQQAPRATDPSGLYERMRQQKQDALRASLDQTRQGEDLHAAMQQARLRATLTGDEAPRFATRRPLSDDERLTRAKQSLARRRDDLLRRVATGDLTPRSRARVQLDQECLQLQAEHARAKQAFDDAVERARQANLPRTSRLLNHVSGLARAGAISGYHTLGKLFSFSMGAGIERPFKELAGAVIDHTPGMRRIAAKADMESGSHVASLARFYSQAAGRGMREAWQTLRTGKSTDSALYGKPRPGEVHRWYDFIGRIHDAEKTPLFTGAMEAYRTKAFAHAIRQGLDPHDPMVRGLINQKSYECALADKLQEPNGFADWIKEAHRKLEAANPVTGRVSTEKVLLSHLIKTFVTKGIVKTPANYVKQTLFERSPIGLIRAFSKASAAHASGVDALTDQEANHIHRLMSLGMIGTAMTLWGMYDATKDEKDRIFGGYYQPGDKRGEGDVDFGRIRIGGHVLPHWASHASMLEPAQFGSTLVRVARSMVKKNGEEKGYLEGAFQAALAPINNAPVVGSVTRLQRDSRQGGVAQLATNLVTGLVPGIVQNLAEDTDNQLPDGDAVPRKPQTLTDALKMGVPGLREDVAPNYYRGMPAWRRQQMDQALGR